MATVVILSNTPPAPVVSAPATVNAAQAEMERRRRRSYRRR